MSKKKSESLTPQQTLERFVIRARRVKAHSLVRSGEVKKYAKPSGTITMSATGEISIKDHVITDEEALESLTARLRPFIVKSEPIHLPEVFEAINSCVTDDALTEDMRKALESAKSWFNHRYEEKDSRAYAIQMLDKGGNSLTDYLSDALLADSWVYTDVVHADPQGDKAEGLKAGYLSRYEAGSSFFCEFALVIVGLLNILKDLDNKGVLQLDRRVWEEPVTYEEAEKHRADSVAEGSLYVFPIGTVPPSGAKPEDIPGAVKATAVVMGILSDPEGRAALVTFDADKNQTARLPVYRKIAGDTLVLLINDALELTVPATAFAEGKSVPLSFSMKPLGKDGEQTLATAMLMTRPNSGELYFNYNDHTIRLHIELTMQSGEEDEIV